MIKDKFSNPLFQVNDIVELMYSGVTDLNDILVEPSTDIAQFEYFSELCLKKIDPALYTVTVEEFDRVCQFDWFIPEEYRQLDIGKYLMDICPRSNQQRLAEELAEFQLRGMMPLLNTLKYLVDTFRANNVVWGVGRGSSVSSYTLFLIGVHRIDSVKYQLDWREFLR